MSEHAEQVRRLQDECGRLREENAQLRAVLASHDLLPKPAIEVSPPAPNETGTVTNSSPPEKKLALFRSLFRGREDVYAVRWEKGGKSGYSPAGIMDWRAILSAKPADRKKVARQTRSLSVLTDQAIREHLEGKSTVGIYPLLPDELKFLRQNRRPLEATPINSSIVDAPSGASGAPACGAARGVASG